MKIILLIALLAIGGVGRAQAETEQALVGGALPLSMASVPMLADPFGELVIRGVNASDEPVTLVLRIDDDLSVDYRHRVNEERMVAPGRFELAFPGRGLARSNGRPFPLADARRLFLFTTAAKVSAEISFRSGFTLPHGAIGFDLGPQGAPVFPGFQPLAPGDPRIVAGAAVGVRRAGAPALTGTGLVGGTVFRFTVPNGRWRVALWTEDPGEWETLPHPLNRRVRVNGADALDYLWTPEEWVRNRYLRLARREPDDLASAWSAFGRLRGGRIDAVADVSDGAVTIELAGEGAAATYLAGVLLQPDDGAASAADAADQERGRRFDADWPVYGETPAGAPDAKIILARGAGARIEIQIPPGRHPVGVDSRSDIRIWAFEARWSLDRRHTGGNLLRRSAAHLAPLGEAIARNPRLPRRVVLWASAEASAAPGPFSGAVRLNDGGSIPFAGVVADIALPPSPLAVGAYLERAPHLDWFTRDQGQGDAQVLCDLQTLVRLGLAPIAPPLPLPTSDAGPAYIQRLQALTDLGFNGPVLAYAPLKRLASEAGAEEAPLQLANLAAALGPARMRRILWSIADEPSNAIHGTNLAELSARLHQVVPGFQAAAHFNHPTDLKDLRGVDVALVNPGLSLEPSLFRALREHGVTPWLYNMGNPRLAAGLWGLKSGAQGYVQWHARMPTADPFDPTDGREGDVQFLYPTAAVCPIQPDIHDDLLRLAEGVIDARWLSWLESRDPKAAARIQVALPERWEDAVLMSDDAVRDLRAKILEVAQGLR